MDVVKWLETLLGDCRLVGSAEEAMALVPSLGLDAPNTMEIPLSGASPWRGSPVGFAKALRQPLGMMVAEAMTEVLGGQAPSDPSQLSLEVLANDAATSVLARLLVEAWRSGPRSASLVMLETVRQASQIAWGDFDELTRYSPAAAARARRAIDDMPDRLKVRVEYLHGLAWALSVRLGGAWALAASLDPSVRPTRLYQALVTNRLALVAPAGALSPDSDLDLIAGVLDIQVEEGILTATHQAVCAVLKVALAGGGDAPGAALRALAGSRSSVPALALDPRLAGLALQALPDLVDAKALKSAGVSKGAQKRLLKREGAAATSALYAQVTSALGTWDVLSALASRCLPIEREGGTWTGRLGNVDGELPWPVLTPRGDGGQADLTLVGVGLDGLWETVRKLAEDQGEPLLVAAAAGLWRQLCDQAPEHGGMATDLGSDGLGLFTSKAAAQQWADAVRSAFRPPLRLDLGPFGDGVSVASGGGVVLNITSGRFIAGWDGARLWAAGSAVAKALPSGGQALDAPDAEEGLEGLAAAAADTSGAADPFGADDGLSPPAAAAAPSPAADDFDPFAASVPPAEPDPPPAADDDFDAFADDEPLGAPPEVDFEEDVPDEGDDDDDAFYLPPPAQGEAPAASDEPDLFMLPPPTEQELAENTPDEVEGTFMLPPPTAQELQDLDQADGDGDGPDAYEIEDEESSVVEEEDEPQAEPDLFDAFDAPVDGDSVDAEDSEADFEAMEGGGAGFRFNDEGAPDQAGAEETFRFESPVFDEPEAKADNGGGFAITESQGKEGDIWAGAEGTDNATMEAGGDLFADESSGLEDSEAPAAPATLGLGMADLRYLFDGYVHYLDGQSGMVFGRRYGDRVLDKHVYDFQGDKDKVYRQFLLDKVEEGFVPRTDLVGDLPAGIEPEGIDLERMGSVASKG